MKTAELRQAFLEYFRQQGHTIVPSSSLVPADDPTLLFTNAGMNQFKDLFLGREKRDYTRATTTQKCVRAGGKHNDLENVGYTARHHTFFEMLGNFSFGDYFKREAINFAWTFLTDEKWLNLPTEKLWITVYAEDDEAFDIWNQEIGVPAERIVRIGDNKGARYASDNFWQMGDTGPCGPCTEIFYDHGPDVAGGPPGSPEEDGDRYIEIWNVVFMQYNRTADGEMLNLPKPSVDTGMGLERITAVLQGVHSNYEIDLFQDLLKAASELLGGVPTTEASLRVVADHIRACAFLISDGVMPSNEGRGFVLRRIIRRAARHGNKLGATQPFFYKLTGALVALMGEAFPQLVSSRKQIEKVLLQEEEQFAKTLDKGLRLLEQDIAELKGKEIPGETVFTLYDTYGFPVDLTNDIARERGLTLDYVGYEKAMEAQRERARAASKFGIDYNAAGITIEGETEFTGYDHIDGHERIRTVLVGGEERNAEAGDECVVVLERTPFYAESGGQVGDTGLLTWSGGRFQVTDTQKEGDNHLHVGTLIEGELFPGLEVDARIDHARRERIKRNHSATHLLHAALRKVLGEHVSQKGSLVDPDKLRFDFSHFEAVTADELQEIERQVNEQILQNTPVDIDITDMETAQTKGAMALFGEKYGDVVRVLSMGEDRYSVELCGGTHVSRTGDIGLFRITSESGISSGVRRIEAVTGFGALEWLDDTEKTLRETAKLVKGTRDSVVSKVQQTLERNRQLEKEVDALKAKLASSAGNDLASSAVEVAGLKVVAAQMEGADRKAMMETADQLKNKLGEGVVVLATVDGDKVVLVAGVTKSATNRIKAGDLMKHLAAEVDGKGGGRPDMAQGGGNDPSKLADALAGVPAWVEQNIG
ncbi:alanine--tRNA ligase [Marinobacter persicus]|uniref:Alanine--tRNA ligase n=1 Tax=Marinobacter persicus TaxID=930118 RepID=A0A2S6G6A2_9GAMM|nr:alanine--tRNA ligase [Marinobacter persicus]PPK51514.1 alanyl-tRNA synthetase [Marinobacter persicus]PPK54674.1 alanyl-tRNA synthetase [Marinobacter persicus]PPK58219.1 alanyl-tRNA synthetase [Marinobacter persicus]